MGTTQATPAADNTKEIRTRVKNVLDLDSKDYIAAVKVGRFAPVANMEEFVSRLGNNSEVILQVVNDGLEEYAKQQLESSADVPYVGFDDEGNATVDLSTKNVLTFKDEDKEKSFTATILNLAKMMFGYPDVARGTKLSADEVKANRAKKETAKAQAIDFVLSNPAAIEALKK